MRTSCEDLASDLEGSHGLIAEHGGKGIEKGVEAVTHFQVVNQVSHRDPRSNKYRRSPENARHAMNDGLDICDLTFSSKSYCTASRRPISALDVALGGYGCGGPVACRADNLGGRALSNVSGGQEAGKRRSHPYVGGHMARLV